MKRTLEHTSWLIIFHRDFNLSANFFHILSAVSCSGPDYRHRVNMGGCTMITCLVFVLTIATSAASQGGFNTYSDKLNHSGAETGIIIFLEKYINTIAADAPPPSLKRKCRHFDEIWITGCTGSCHFDNFQCSQWWKFHQNEDISVSVLRRQHISGQGIHCAG